ncbi:BREX-1 system phosphatase PglZ type A [Virgibacillus pantothenticus]|uniref:BREX-1 system phosphatase PglZ type A n=1 Tax=Virgibacillus pantothenticus TaxID=1473 RepID=UPI002DB7579D|nr:BREX-1 system phosphatase PglZ type A [Virgibacillus pantothenticus]MEB5469793.1 BREX-1 system phosphatase PglZ type A [Virgibacillus pantothenticus]
MREVFKNYKVFFNNRTRFQAFRRFNIEFYTEEAIDLTVLAVLTKSPANNLDEIVKSLFKKLVMNDNTAAEAIRKYGNEEKLWSLIEKYYGYVNKDKSLQSLLKFLIITYLNEQNHTLSLPEEWNEYIGNRITNIVVFMDQWMNHREDREFYNTLSDQVALDLRLKEVIQQWDIAEIKEMDAFRSFDKRIIQYLVEQLTESFSEFDNYLELIHTRRKLHWYPEFEQMYKAIHSALQLKRYLHEMDYFISEQSATQMFESYANKYYKLDYAYRKFYVAYDQIVNKEMMYPLREEIENLYVNRFIEELGVKWGDSLERATRAAWPITAIPQQSDFYREWVKPRRKHEERVFVIISDALRYEVAKELMDDLNNERKASTSIVAMQGVLPSYTALGMASLLPYQSIEYGQDGQVYIDKKSTTGLENRQQILAKEEKDSIVIPYQEVMGMNRATLRETTQGKKVIYIYHNAIDARADNASTEIEVFEAAENAINDIRLLVNRLVANISVSNILITADHGFLYQRDALVSSQKLPNDTKDTIVSKRRFSVMDHAYKGAGTLTYSLNYILNQEKELFVTVPKGVTRFSIQGAGSNYVHGGAMLQEIVIPVITFKNDRSKSSKNLVKKVNVKLTTPTRKITNPITFLEFLQTEKVENKRLSRRLVSYFTDEAGNRVSNENIIIADKTISQAGERTYREKFVFRSIQYDKRKNYYLVLEDEGTGEEYERYGFIIDIVL